MFLISLFCLACTFQEFSRNNTLTTLMHDTIPTQCFTEKMAEKEVPQYWIDEIQHVYRAFPIRYYREDTRTMAYMNPGSDNIFLNRKFFDTMTMCQRASTLSHEVLHVLGFRHKMDAAYAVNYAFEACCVEP